MRWILCSKLKASLLKNTISISEYDKILVLPICTMNHYVNDEEQWNEYYGENGIQAKKILSELSTIGAKKENVCFYNYMNNKNINNELDETYSYLIIPGGDAELGVLRANDLGLREKINNFKGQIIAYSAGALMLFDDYFLSPNWYYTQMKYCKGLRIGKIPPWLIEVHYDDTIEMKKYINDACSILKKDVFAIADDGIICYDGDSGEVDMYGRVIRFNVIDNTSSSL